MHSDALSGTSFGWQGTKFRAGNVRGASGMHVLMYQLRIRSMVSIALVGRITIELERVAGQVSGILVI
jgi:hypothetical protein